VYPQWTGRRDKNGLPLYAFKISELTKEKINAYSKDPEKLVPRMIGLYEVREHSYDVRSKTDDQLGCSTWSSSFSHSPVQSLTRQTSPSQLRRRVSDTSYQ
jgi:hypothetical protein